MYPSVQAVWTPINTRLEGALAFMYLDVLGYVTTGMGDLADPIDSARALPWVRHDGTPASDAEVVAAWDAVDACRTAGKGMLQPSVLATVVAAWDAVDACRTAGKGMLHPSGLTTRYGQAFAGVTSIRLTNDGVAQTVLRQVARNEIDLRRFFRDYDAMPADGQMAVNSMAWAMGSGFPEKFHLFTTAVNDGDWETAKAQSPFKGSGVQHRIDMDTALLENAARVSAAGSDPSVLWYPDVAPPAPPG